MSSIITQEKTLALPDYVKTCKKFHETAAFSNLTPETSVTISSHPWQHVSAPPWNILNTTNDITYPCLLDHVEGPSRMTSSHTDCHFCLQSLRGRKYALREENAYCVPCYDSLYANPCEECKQPIECNSKDLAYKGHHWHERCFRCAKCSRSLVEKPFAAKDEVLLCTECYSDEYSSKCFHCQKTIMPGSRKMEFKGSSWHESCFVCQYCRQPLGTKPLITKDNENYCVPCYEKQFAHHCYACKKVITSGGVSYHDQPWHKECFVCAGCKTQLFGQRFISKDEYPYCVDCFSKFYAKKCAACKKPITALGGAKYISFEERQWHGECFNCVKCSFSLVGQDFLTRQDDILCHKCGSAS